MAEVYLAEFRPRSGFLRVVVMKKIIRSHERDSRWVESFLKEVRIMMQLTHSNIVQISDFGKSKGGFFYVMEYVDGANLGELKSTLGKFPKKYVLFIGLEILKGLSYAHRAGILHRDLSPSNILVSRAGEVKIADFGVAKFVVDEEKTQFLKGKMSYMSPEQKERSVLTEATDIYSLALVLFELLTGRTDRGEANEFRFLEGALAKDPKVRWNHETFEANLKNEIKNTSGLVSQTDFTEFLAKNYFKPSPTQTLFKPSKSHSEYHSVCHPEPIGRGISFGITQRLGVITVACLLGILGTRAPEFYGRGYLSLSVKPWGEVFYRGKRLGVTPFVHYPLPTGRYDFLLSNFILQKTIKLNIEIRPYEVTKVRITF